MHLILRLPLLFATPWLGVTAAEYFPKPGRYEATCYTVGGSNRAEVIAKNMGEADRRP